jgi:hypothetical protein
MHTTYHLKGMDVYFPTQYLIRIISEDIDIAQTVDEDLDIQI